MLCSPGKYSSKTRAWHHRTATHLSYDHSRHRFRAGILFVVLDRLLRERARIVELLGDATGFGLGVADIGSPRLPCWHVRHWTGDVVLTLSRWSVRPGESLGVVYDLPVWVRSVTRWPG